MKKLLAWLVVRNMETSELTTFYVNFRDNCHNYGFQDKLTLTLFHAITKELRRRKSALVERASNNSEVKYPVSDAITQQIRAAIAEGKI